MNPRQTTPWRRRRTEPLKKLPYKTELCNKWIETGSCRYGNKCRFAHGGLELKFDIRNTKNFQFKTQRCKNYHGEATTCNYGKRCHYIHDESEEELAAMRLGPMRLGPICSGPKRMDDKNQYAASTQPIPTVPNDSDRAASYFRRYIFPTQPVIPVAAIRTDSWKFLEEDALNAGDLKDGGYINGFSLEAKPFTPSSPPPTPQMHPRVAPKLLLRRNSFFKSITHD